MHKVLYKPIYNRTKKLRKDGTALIQIECYQNGKRFLISTGIYITPNLWNERTRKIKTDHVNAHKLNKQISETIANLENYELDAINKGKSFTLDNLREYYQKEEISSFSEFMQVELNRAKISISTRKTHQRTLDVLIEFKKVVQFDDVNVSFLQDFERYLYKKDLGNNTVYKYFKNIKTYVNLAIAKGLYDANNYPFPKLKLKQSQGKRDFLTPEELERIENLKFTVNSTNGIEKIRDMFLFSCFTGLRFSDIININFDNLEVIGSDTWLVVEMEKSKIANDSNTAQIVRIPISKLFNGKPIEIMNKYKSEQKFLFDDYTNQYVNRVLKDIAKLAKINKLVTFHVARHTQATYLLYKGVNITTVSKLLGHQKISTTQIYAKIMDKTILNDLENIQF